MIFRKVIIQMLALWLVAVPLLGVHSKEAQAATSRVAIIKEMRGIVQVKKSGGSKTFKAFAKMSLNEGDVLMSDTDSTAVLQFANGSSHDDQISVSANTTLTFSKLSDRNGTRTKVSMFNGTAWVDVKSIKSKNDEFTLETPTAVMGVRGTHLLVDVDPATGSTRLSVAAGIVKASMAGGSEQRNVLPNQDALLTPNNGAVTIAPTDLELLMTQADKSIIEAIIKAAGEIEKENMEKKSQYVEQSGLQSPEDQARLKSNVENLLGAIVDNAIKSGLISAERANQLVTESQAQTGVTIDLSKKEIVLSDEEKRQQERQRQEDEDAKKSAIEQKKQQEEERKKYEELLKKLDDDRKKKVEANNQALEAKKAKAETEYLKQLDEAAKQRFQADRENRIQEQQSSPTPSPKPTPSPTPTYYTVSFNSNGGSSVSSISVARNALVEEPAAPTKLDHTFAGWYSDSGLTQPFSFTTMPIAGNMTLYAKWYTLYLVTYDGNGNTSGTLTALDRIEWTGTSSPTSGEVLSNMLDGNQTTRWSTGTTMAPGQYFIIDMKSVRNFSRIVMDSDPSGGDYARGFEVYVSNDGSTWGSSIASGSGNGAKLTVDFASQNARYLKVVQTGNEEGLGFWSIHELNVYTEGSAPTDSNLYMTGATVTVLGNMNRMVKTGYTFAGWNTAADGSGTHYAPGSTFLMGSGITLYAQWTILYGFVNEGFEAPDLTEYENKFMYNPSAPGWIFTGYSGIAHNGSAFGNVDAPAGAQAAILQMSSSFRQEINLLEGNYQISFDAAQRGGNQQQFDVYLDSTLIGSFTPASSNFYAYTTNIFTVTAGTHTVEFVGKTSSDHTAFIDNIMIVESHEDPASSVAMGITSITAPAAGATSLSMPNVPPGYTIAIYSSSNTGVIGTNGVITPPAAATDVNLVFRVTRTSDNSTADTGTLTVTVPAAPLQNLAAGKIPTSNGYPNPARMTDGNLGEWSDGGAGLKWVVLDLGASYDLQMVKLWHYYWESRAYHDVIVQLSDTPDFSSGVTTVFNNDTDNSAGQGIGTDDEYVESSAGKTITFSPVNARYVRIWSNGSSQNAANHLVEIEVYGD